jgi:hypothetical protein
MIADASSAGTSGPVVRRASTRSIPHGAHSPDTLWPHVNPKNGWSAGGIRSGGKSSTASLRSLPSAVRWPGASGTCGGIPMRVSRRWPTCIASTWGSGSAAERGRRDAARSGLAQNFAGIGVSEARIGVIGMEGGSGRHEGITQKRSK